jgi:hypothetical protein
MTIRRNLGRLAITTIAVTTVFGASFGSAAFAADAADVTVTGGSLGITVDPTVGNFAGVTLDGTAKSTTASFDGFEVNDARGTGAGWNVTVQATQFAEWDSTLNAGAGGYVTSGKTLALNSLSLAAPTVAADGTTSAAPSITAGPYNVDAGSAVKIASAAVDAGMGKYDFTQAATPLTLSIPSSAYAKTYRSTVTVSTVTGP